MKNQFLNLGKVLTNAEQKMISGGKEAPIKCGGEICHTGRCDYRSGTPTCY